MRKVGLWVRTEKVSSGESWWQSPALLVLLSLSLAVPCLAVPGGSQGLSLITRTFEGVPRDVVLAGDLAYLGLDTGLAVVDIGEPAALEVVSHLYLPSPALSLSRVGSLVYVANGASGLSVVDVSNPAAPFLVSVLGVGDVRDVALVGDLVYLALVAGDVPGTRNGLCIVDVADPAGPFELGFTETNNGALSVSIRGTRALVGTGSALSSSHGLVVLDVIDAMAPTPIAWLATGEPVNDIEDQGALAYLATGTSLSGHLRTIDLSSPSLPFERCKVSVGDSALSVAVVADVAHVASRSLGLKTFDVGDPDTLVALDTLPTGREAWAVASEGSVSYLCERSSAGRAGFTAIATPPWPARLAVVGTLPFAEVNDVAVLPGTAFILRRDALHVLDDALNVIGSWDPPGADLSSLAVEPGLAAVADGDTVHLLDLSSMAAPVEEAVVTLSGGVAVSVELADGVLYVVDGTGLQTFDVGVPASPSVLGSYRTSGVTAAVDVVGRYAYLAAGATLEILDVSNPALPMLLAQVPLPGQAYGLAVDEGIVALCGLGYSVMLVDVAELMNPVLIGSLAGPNSFDIALRTAHAVVAAGEGGVLLVGLSDPTAPTLVGWYETSDRPVAVALQADGVTHVAGEASQHWVLDCPDCVAACTMLAQLDLPMGPFCQGDEVLISAEGSELGSCPAGDERYAWFEDDVVLPAEGGDTLLLPTDHAAGTFDFSVELTCATGPACFSDRTVALSLELGSAPVIDPASLRLLKMVGTGTEYVSWVISAGMGSSNLHRSLDPAELSTPALSMSSLLIGVSEDGVIHDASFGDATVAFFRVFPANSCSGESVYPGP